MASRLSPSAQTAIPKCKLCNHGNKARWICMDCDEEMCRQCKDIHLRSKSGKNHNFVNYAVDVDVEEVAETPEQKESICPSHPKEPVQMYCINCKLQVCLKCIAGDHQTHKFETIEDATEKYRKELSQCITDTKEELIGFQSFLRFVQNTEQDYVLQNTKTMDQINKQRQTLKSKVDAAADNMIQQVKQDEVRDLQVTKKKSTEINTGISDRNHLLQICEAALQPNSRVSILETVVEVQQIQEKYKPCPTPTPIRPQRFFSIDSVNLQQVFGHLDADNEDEKCTNTNLDSSSTINTTVMANINPGRSCDCVSVVNDRQAWCGGSIYGGDNSVALININGQIVKKVGLHFQIADITVDTYTGDLLLTEYDGHIIHKYTRDGKIANTVDISPCEAGGLCMTADNDILVCLYTDNYRQNNVKRITTSGQVKQIIKPNKNNKPCLTDPRYVKENINKDVCIVNKDDLVVVNKHGDLRFTYSLPNSSFFYNHCWGITCDRLGYILLSDFSNQCIHQVSKDGQYIQKVTTDQYGISKPHGLSIDNKGQLWICDGADGSVKVIKYR